jgi:hypothetical protein
VQGAFFIPRRVNMQITINPVKLELTNEGDLVISQPDVMSENGKASIYLTAYQIGLFYNAIKEILECQK